MLLQLPVGGICSAAAWGPWGLGAPRTVPKKTVNRFFLGKVYQFVAKIVEVWALGFHGSAGFQAMCHGVGVAAQSMRVRVPSGGPISLTLGHVSGFVNENCSVLPYAPERAGFRLAALFSARRCRSGPC